MISTSKIEIRAAAGPIGRRDWIAFLNLYLDADGDAVLTADEMHNSELHTWTQAIQDKRGFRWRSSLSLGAMVVPSVEAMAELAQQLEPLVARVAAGHSIGWNGSNSVGTLTPDAADAADELSNRFMQLETHEWCADTAVWDAAEWIGLEARRGVRATTTDAELEAMAVADAEVALREGVVLCGSTFDERRMYRDEMRAELEDE